jgi:gliding motility-associated-like protein
MKIEEIYKKALENRHPKVNKDIWGKLEKKIEASQTIPKAPKSNGAAHSIANSIKHLSTVYKVAAITLASSAVVAGATYMVINKISSNNTITNTNITNVNHSNAKVTPYLLDTLQSNNTTTKEQTNNETINKETTMPTYTITDEDNNKDMSSLNPITKPQSFNIQQPTVIKQYANHNTQKVDRGNMVVDTNRNHNESDEIHVHIPNVITPNGDGINDCFVIGGIDNYPDNTLIIFNRQGKVVLTRNHYKNDFCGENLLQGAYFYSLKIRINSKTRTINGSLAIIY